jgi:hypothetical protein
LPEASSSKAKGREMDFPSTIGPLIDKIIRVY